MPRVAVGELLSMLDGAFDTAVPVEDSQALLPNLRDATEDLWRLPPPGGSRAIDSILFHLGACKVVVNDLTFGDGSLGYDSPLAMPPIGGSLKEMVEWLRAAQQSFRDNLAALEDAHLEVLRKTGGGRPISVRGLVQGFIQHDLYHAGEINVIRGLLAGEDRWPHERARG
jgi:hypothetical protein